MDVLKQLETKLQALVTQRNQYRDELAALKADQGSQDEELRTLRRRRDLRGEPVLEAVEVQVGIALDPRPGALQARDHAMMDQPVREDPVVSPGQGSEDPGIRGVPARP